MLLNKDSFREGFNSQLKLAFMDGSFDALWNSVMHPGGVGAGMAKTVSDWVAPGAANLGHKLVDRFTGAVKNLGHQGYEKLTDFGGHAAADSFRKGAVEVFGDDAVMGADGSLDRAKTIEGIFKKYTPNAVSGAAQGVAGQLGVNWNKDHTASQNIADHFKWDMTKGWGDNLKSFAGNNPFTTGALALGGGALALGAGNAASKFFGGEGGSTNNNNGGGNNNQSNGNQDSAYTSNSHRNTPQALTKAGEMLNSLGALPVPAPLKPALLGFNLMQGINDEPTPTRNTINVSPANRKAEIAMQDPQMQAYLNNLISRSM